MHIHLLALLACLMFACSSETTQAPPQVYTVTFRYQSGANLALAVADPEGRLGDHTCRIEVDRFGSETICSVVWTEPGTPGVLVFDLLATGNSSSRCEEQLRTGTAAGRVSVELWNGPRLRISPPQASSLAGRCGFTVTTNNTL
jgi:hypothetical protein